MDVFISSLYHLSEYGGLCDKLIHDLIHDQIVIGVRDKTLSTKIQMEEGLTLYRDSKNM